MRLEGPLALLAALVLVRIAYGVQFQSVGAVGPAMVEDLRLSYTALGSLVGAYSLLGLLLSLPAGWIVTRYGERRVVLGSVALMAIGGAVIAAAGGHPMILAGRLVSGTGAILLIVTLTSIVAERFAGPTLPAAMGTMLVG